MSRSTLPIVIFDLDGTLCDSSKRLEDIGFDPKAPISQWPTEWGDHLTDQPIMPAISILRDLYESNRIWILTIRKDIPETGMWLNNHEVFHDQLFQIGDDSQGLSPAEMKEHWLSTLSTDDREKILCAYEDSPSMIKMFRHYGIFTLDVGQFEGSM
jgi:hypothetical protein